MQKRACTDVQGVSRGPTLQVTRTTVWPMRIDPTWAGPLRRGARQLTRVLMRRARSSGRSTTPGRASPSRRTPGGQASAPSDSPGGATGQGGYAGDYAGVPHLEYTPVDDAHPDPGEVVWAWVPYEEDHTQGKDRPVLVIGRESGLLLALPLTSRDRTRDGDVSGRSGFVDVGTGSWDRQSRPSEANVERILQLDPTSVRRTGSALPRERFDRVADAVRARG